MGFDGGGKAEGHRKREKEKSERKNYLESLGRRRGRVSTKVHEKSFFA